MALEEPITIPFLDFAPDLPEYSEGMLDEATNVLPVFNGWRGLEKLSVVVADVSDDPIERAYAHMFEDPETFQFGEPESDDTVGNWTKRSSDRLLDPATDLYEYLAGDVFDDTEYIISPGGPTSEVYEVEINDLTDPTGETSLDHTVLYRFEVRNLDPADTWTLVVKLLEGATEIATKTETGTGDQGWAVGSFSLVLVGEEDQITYGATNLQIQFDATTDGAQQTLDPVADGLIGEWSKVEA